MAELMDAVGGGRGGRGGRGRKKGGKKALKKDVEVAFGQGRLLCFFPRTACSVVSRIGALKGCTYSLYRDLPVMCNGSASSIDKHEKVWVWG